MPRQVFLFFVFFLIWPDGEAVEKTKDGRTDELLTAESEGGQSVSGKCSWQQEVLAVATHSH